MSPHACELNLQHGILGICRANMTEEKYLDAYNDNICIRQSFICYYYNRLTFKKQILYAVVFSVTAKIN